MKSICFISAHFCKPVDFIIGTLVTENRSKTINSTYVPFDCRDAIDRSFLQLVDFWEAETRTCEALESNRACAKREATASEGKLTFEIHSAGRYKREKAGVKGELLKSNFKSQEILSIDLHNLCTFLFNTFKLWGFCLFKHYYIIFVLFLVQCNRSRLPPTKTFSLG